MRWFRHYTGMMRDPKFVSISIKTKQSIERVAFVWGCILEDAGDRNGAGRYVIDPAELAHHLQCEVTDISIILEAIVSAGLTDGNVVTRWKERNFTDPTNALRQKRHREKKAIENGGDSNGARNGARNGHSNAVTSRPLESESELESESYQRKKETRTRASPRALAPGWPSDYQDRFWKAFPNKVGKAAALKQLDRIAVTGKVGFEAMMLALDRYANKADDRHFCNPATWLNEERWTDEPALQLWGQRNGRSNPNAEAFAALRELDLRIQDARNGGCNGGGIPDEGLPHPP